MNTLLQTLIDKILKLRRDLVARYFEDHTDLLNLSEFLDGRLSSPDLELLREHHIALPITHAAALKFADENELLKCLGLTSGTGEAIVDTINSRSLRPKEEIPGIVGPRTILIPQLQAIPTYTGILRGKRSRKVTPKIKEFRDKVLAILQEDPSRSVPWSYELLQEAYKARHGSLGDLPKYYQFNRAITAMIEEGLVIKVSAPHPASQHVKFFRLSIPAPITSESEIPAPTQPFQPELMESAVYTIDRPRDILDITHRARNKPLIGMHVLIHMAVDVMGVIALAGLQKIRKQRFSVTEITHWMIIHLSKELQSFGFDVTPTFNDAKTVNRLMNVVRKVTRELAHKDIQALYVDADSIGRSTDEVTNFVGKFWVARPITSRDVVQAELLRRGEAVLPVRKIENPETIVRYIQP